MYKTPSSFPGRRTQEGVTILFPSDFLERSQRDKWIEITIFACKELSSFLDVSLLQFVDNSADSSVEAIYFLLHFSPYGSYMIVRICVISIRKQ